MSSTYEFDTDRYAGSGIIIKGIAGEVVGNRKLIYMGPLGTWLLADADLAATLPGLGLTLNGAALGGRIEILLKGYVGDTAWAWTVGGEIYASSTAGELTQVAAGLVQIVGMAGPSTDFIYFNGDFSTGAGGVVCALLEGHTAYVGFDICKGTNYTNYFTVDGTADDVQIQQAVDYVTAIGAGSVFLEEGTYDITAPVQISSTTAFMGVGDATVLVLANGVDDNVLESNGRVSNVDISDLMIDGNTAGNAAGHAIQIDGFYCRVFNVFTFDVPQDSVNFTSAVATSTNRVFDCRFESGRYGIYIHGDVNDGYIHNVTMRSGTNGIYMLGSSWQVENCIIFSTSGDGIASFVSNNFNNIRVSATGGHGIALYATANNIYSAEIIDCSIWSLSDANNGIRLEAGGAWDLQFTRVENNRCSEADIGILEVGTNAERNIILGNSLVGNGTGGLSLVGTGTTAFRNLVDGTQSIAIDVALPEVFVKVSDPDSSVGDHPALVLPDTVDTTFRFQVVVPLEFQQLITAQPIVIQTATGGPPDMQWSTTTDWGKLCAGENYNAGSDAETDQTTAVAQNELVCIDVSASLTGIAAGDLVGFTFIRRASQAGDTIDSDAHYLGFRLRYI